MASFSEKLIESVRMYDLLYDPTSKNYHDSVLKQNAWEDIAARLNTKVLVCKTRWFAIRDNYRKALKKRRMKNATLPVRMTPYKYEDVLSFLTPFISEREPLSNTLMADNPAEEETQDQQAEELTEASELLPFDIDCIEEVKPPSCGTGCQPQCIGTALQNYLQRKNDREVRHKDHLTKFFEAMESSVRTLKPELQIEAKKKIAMIVMDSELKNIMPETSIQPLSSLASSSTSALPLHK